CWPTAAGFPPWCSRRRPASAGSGRSQALGLLKPVAAKSDIAKRMYRKAFIVLALFAAMPGQAPPAFASVPSVLVSTTTTGDRYQSQVTFTYDVPVSVSDPSTQVSFHKTGSVTPLAVTVTGSGTATIVVTQTGTLASGASYTASVRPDPDATPDIASWK